MSASPAIDLAASGDALRELREARRRNHRRAVHWVDALYKVYMTALGVGVFVVLASGWFPGGKLDAEAAATFAARGPAWLGLGIAAAVLFGLRSGGRGGPLTLEAPTVFHELLAPVDLATALRSPAIKQLRFLAFSGTLAGAVVGVVAARRMPVNEVAVVAASALTFGAAAVLANAAAMVASGRRLGVWVANLAGLALVGWSVADSALEIRTSPLTYLGAVAFWPLRFEPVALAALAVPVAAAWFALAGIGGTSIEAARLRAGLVSQLRFAVTMQDIRTVVLLRRQLANERPRNRPWVRLPRGKRLPATWHRDWQGFARFPGVRLVRLLVLAAVAGVAAGFAWRGTAPAIVVSALALYLAGYEAVEPIAQEVDHPTRWDGNGEEYGTALLRHLPAAIALLVVIILVAGAFSLVLVPAKVVGTLLPVLVLPAAAAAALGAAVSTVLGGNTVNAIVDTGEMTKMDLQSVAFDPNTAGFLQVFRWGLPPGMVVAALAPLLAAGHDPDNLHSTQVSNLTMWSMLLVAGAAIWLRTRRPARI